MSAHTPGPWRDIGGCGHVFAEVDWDDQSVDRVIVMSQLASVDTSRKTWEANARLIVAAPDLLAALQALVAELDGPGKPDSSDSYAPEHFVTAAKAAIAKATNGASK